MYYTFCKKILHSVNSREVNCEVRVVPEFRSWLDCLTLKCIQTLQNFMTIICYLTPVHDEYNTAARSCPNIRRYITWLCHFSCVNPIKTKPSRLAIHVVTCLITIYTYDIRKGSK